MSIRPQVLELIELVKQAKFLEAIERFYAADAEMRENQDAARVGLEALLENERNVLRNVPDIRLERLESFLVDGNRAAIHWVFAFTDPKGGRRRLEEISYQEWRDGKIVREQFFYDPSQRHREAV